MGEMRHGIRKHGHAPLLIFNTTKNPLKDKR